MTTDAILDIIKLFISAVLGGALVAWANWGIEKRRQKLNYRRELIISWRKMISYVEQIYGSAQSSGNLDISFAEILEKQPEYFSLKPHLCPETLEALKKEKYNDVISLVVTGQKKVLLNPSDYYASILVDEIARIEKGWDLV